MKAKDLKNSILQMAVQGKLVPQNPKDEPASALLERIREERAALIKEKKIKAPKGGESVIYRGSDGSYYEKRGNGSPVCIDDKIPFEIPDSWEWCRLGHLFDMQAGKNIAASNISSTPDYQHQYPCFGGNGIRGYVAQSNRSGDYPLIGRQGALCGNVNRATGDFYATEHAVVTSVFADMSVDWSCEMLTALDLNQYATATAQPGLSVSKISEVLSPVPPVTEQNRIVKVLAQLVSRVDEYGALEEERKQLDAELPERLRKSILQMAVQGKLVPQDPNDEPASVLLGRIREERAKLIGEKKLKAPKGGESIIYRGSDGGYYEKRGSSEPVCIDDEIPFEMPESWEWARLESIAVLERGSGIKRTEVSQEGMPCVRYGELYTTYKEEIAKVATRISVELYSKCHTIEPDDVVLTLTGENNVDIGRAVVNATGDQLAFGGDLLAVKEHRQNGAFLAAAIRSEYVRRQRTAAATGNIIVHLGMTKVGSFLVAIPPLKEQERIMEALESSLSSL